MADAWETLLDNSTLIPPGFDAWTHLNAQGGGIGVGVVLMDGLELEMDDACVDVELELEDAILNDDSVEFDVELELSEYDVEIC